MKTIVIIGAGQYGNNVRDIIVSNGSYESIVFADDNSCLAEYTIDESIALDNVDYCIAIGNANARETIFNKIISKGKRVATIIHKSAFVATSAQVEEGCIVEPNVSIGANATIKKSSLICYNAVVNHNATVGEYAQIDIGAVVKAGANIKAKQKVESGQVNV